MARIRSAMSAGDDLTRSAVILGDVTASVVDDGIHAVASGLVAVPTRMPTAIGTDQPPAAPFEYGQVVEQVCASLFHQRILVRVEATT